MLSEVSEFVKKCDFFLLRIQFTDGINHEYQLVLAKFLIIVCKLLEFRQLIAVK